MFRYISCHRKEVEQHRDGIRGILSVAQGVDGCKAEFVLGRYLRIGYKLLKILGEISAEPSHGYIETQTLRSEL